MLLEEIPVIAWAGFPGTSSRRSKRNSRWPM